MRLKCFLSRPSFGDVACVASHDIGAINAVEMFFKSTKLWRWCECCSSRYWGEKCDRKFFEVDQALDMVRVPRVTILVREMRLKFFFEGDQALEMLRVSQVTKTLFPIFYHCFSSIYFLFQPLLLGLFFFFLQQMPSVY